MTTIGLLHPGEMGASVGAAARAEGSRVLWASEGRSTDTWARAATAELDDVVTLPAVVAASDVIVSVCPPHAARDVASAVAGAGFRGLYVDANAVAPATSRAIAGIVEAAGATYVDGGIIGPPPDKPGTTRLYLSGAQAARVAALFTKGPLEAIVLPGELAAASAIKMAYGGWNKGQQALLLSIVALATSEGVAEALMAEWKRSQPDLPKRAENAARGSSRKAWRWIAEMEENAATLDAAGLPAGFHQGAAEIYKRLAPYKDAGVPPTLEDVAKGLLTGESRGGRGPLRQPGSDKS
jgi:3-hydroxyisobutyrate dehydrogenase-like beta-hydroxyacid dehydrogenase